MRGKTVSLEVGLQQVSRMPASDARGAASELGVASGELKVKLDIELCKSRAKYSRQHFLRQSCWCWLCPHTHCRLIVPRDKKYETTCKNIDLPSMQQL